MGTCPSIAGETLSGEEGLDERGVGGDVERHLKVQDLSDRLNHLRSRGRGYVEVRLPDREYSVLILAFRNDHAVVQLMSDTG